MRAVKRRKGQQQWRPPQPALAHWGMVVLLGLAGLASGLTGCGSIAPVAPTEGPITDPAQLYTSLAFDHPAVLMSTAAPYNTVQLTATPRNALRGAMSGLPSPIYHSSDTTKVWVTPDGVVTAVGTTSGVKVSAAVTLGPVTHVDTALIVVTNATNPTLLDTLSIHPLLPDSTIWPLFDNDGGNTTHFSYTLLSFAGYLPRTGTPAQLVSRTVSATGSPITGLPIAYQSLDPAIAIVRDDGTAVTIRPGQVRMVAQTLAYGVPKADTVTFTVTLAVSNDISIAPDANSFAPTEVRIRPYGIIFWYNHWSGDTVELKFDDPTHVATPPVALCGIIDFFTSFGLFDPEPPACDTGDMLLSGVLHPYLPTDPNPPNSRGTIQVRQFPVPGVYSYHLIHGIRTGTSGKIIVTVNP